MARTTVVRTEARKLRAEPSRYAAPRGHRKPTYPAALRFARLVHELHRRPGGVSLADLRVVLDGISDRAIRRYVAACRELTDHRGRPVIEPYRIAGRPALRLADHAVALDSAKYDVLAVYFALALLRVLEGTAFRDSAQRLWERLRRALPPLTQTRLGDVDRKFYSIPYAVKDYREHTETVDLIVQCLLEQRRMRIDYGDPPRTHEFEAYTLAEYRGGLYLIGRSHMGEKIVTLAVERIRRADRLPERFDYPARYSPAKHTEGTFGIIEGEETRVDLRILNDDTLRFLRARRIHPTQQFRRRSDGTWLLSMRVRGTTELANWVLGHTPWIEVIRPRELREHVKERLAKAVALY
jgi:predicted DNA-binding transcriptional regulator YafY